MTPRKKPEDMLPRGRPTLYKPAYCNEVIETCAQGLSLTAFAGVIGVARDSIDEWKNTYPDFSVACKVAKAKRTHFLETRMLKSDATSPIVTSSRFALVNAAPEEWTEKAQMIHGVTDAVSDLLEMINGQSRGRPNPK